MNVELVAQMFKNYQSNVLFHLEGMYYAALYLIVVGCIQADTASHRQSQESLLAYDEK